MYPLLHGKEWINRFKTNWSGSTDHHISSVIEHWLMTGIELETFSLMEAAVHQLYQGYIIKSFNAVMFSDCMTRTWATLPLLAFTVKKQI